MGDQIEREEHEEFKRRLEDWNKRQDERLKLAESSIKRLEAMNSSIEKLAINMECMLKEQVEQGKRLEILESRDGEMWRKVVSHAITVIVGILLGFVFKQIGM